MSKSINDLDKFPASKVRWLAKKMESSKSATRHIKAVASDPQVAQVNLMRHQRTDLPPSKPNGNKIPTSLDQRVTRCIQVNTRVEDYPTGQDLIQSSHIKKDTDVPSVEILNMLKVLNVQQESFNARPAINMGT